MKVIASKRGYFGKLREPGDEFDVPAGSKASWFAPVEASPSKPKGKPAPADDRPDELA